MRKCIALLCVLSGALFASAEVTNRAESLMKQTGRIPELPALNCDTVLTVDGYAVRVVKNEGKVTHIGLNLFSGELKNSIGRSLLDYIEEALLAKSQGIRDDYYKKVAVTNGSVTDFRELPADTPCQINTRNSRTMEFEWTSGAKRISVTVPVSYDTGMSGSRSDIENGLIGRVRKSDGKRHSFGPVDTTRLEAYGEELFIYPGAIYQTKGITRNVYFESDENDVISPVWNTAYPLESMANAFLFPAEKYGDIMLNLTVLKHEYGEKETLTVPLNRFLAACEDDGCVAYWGVEKYENGLLKGALFLYNQGRGYDHVFRIECNPAEVIAGGAEIKARGGLFIPTNNVNKLFAPYVKKTEKEKIKYE